MPLRARRYLRERLVLAGGWPRTRRFRSVEGLHRGRFHVLPPTYGVNPSPSPAAAQNLTPLAKTSGEATLSALAFRREAKRAQHAELVCVHASRGDRCRPCFPAPSRVLRSHLADPLASALTYGWPCAPRWILSACQTRRHTVVLFGVRSELVSRAELITAGAAVPLLMDVHNIEGGVPASDVAEAHKADSATQGGFGVKYRRYWVDEEAGKTFCLVDAPDAKSALIHSLRGFAEQGNPLFMLAVPHEEFLALRLGSHRTEAGRSLDHSPSPITGIPTIAQRKRTARGNRDPAATTWLDEPAITPAHRRGPSQAQFTRAALRDFTFSPDPAARPI